MEDPRWGDTIADVTGARVSSFDFEAFAAECPSAWLVVRDDGSVVFANRAIASLVGRGLNDVQRDGLAILVPARNHPASKAGGWIHHMLQVSAGTGHFRWPLAHRSTAEIECNWTLVVGHDTSGRELASIHLRQGSWDLLPAPLRLTAKGPSADQIDRIIFETAPIGIFHFDGRGVITECNDRFVALIGSSRRNIIGLKVVTLPNDAISRAMKRCLDGELTTYEGPYTSATGNKTSFVRVIMAPTFEDAGGGGAKGNPVGASEASRAVTGGVGLVEDITLQRRTAEALARTERLASLGTLAAGVVEGVQNPLAYVLANLDLALRVLDTQSPGEEAPRSRPTLPSEGEPGVARSPGQDLRVSLVAARQGISRIANIARDLKTFALSDEAPRAPVDLRSAIEAALAQVRPALEAKAKLDLSIHRAVTVHASHPRLVQLFVNLLTNAAEAIPAGDPARHRVRVVMDPPVFGVTETVRVVVADTGPGVRPPDAAHIFEPFWSGTASSPGLGLAICHGIVSALGGEIYLDRDYHEGARFVIILPCADRLTNPALVPPSSLPARNRVSTAPRKRGRVLIVDDEERLAETLKISLSMRHDTDVATGGRRAIERLTTGPLYDVVLCDISMPDVTGAGVYEQVTRLHPIMADRFVFLTGGAFTDSMRDFLQSVPNVRLEKPFDLDELERVVDEAVELSQVHPAQLQPP